MEIITNVLILLKILGLAIVGSLGLCLAVSMLAGLLEKIEGVPSDN
ncbi:hypothetical protein [Treponema brennaborense]|uniref:Uncharacterized protein n=1 Tax=Treponema brennaborense (strain DSM 12168 / CIP 105900 / DD5/3) TaxID=906968 RepID=F4LNU0_TREBD|nr:hypothetical protein [Treponema brennaborense]AEE16925.1 hypothetical protein Trebr_1502 [Treponema brennaborense DSM 12168]